VVVGAVGFLWWARPQPLLPEAEAALSSTPAATYVAGADGRLTWTPTAAPPTTGLVLYTGGKVPPAAYAPAARAISEQGFLVAIVPAPFNLAILDTNAAVRVIVDHPEIDSWAVGGHSLGGASAALFIDGHPGVVDGLVLWAAYASVDLSTDDLRVLNAYGSLDAGAASYTDPANAAKLGTNVVVVVIDGGNHEQMGWYTGQPNDPPATISRDEQHDRIVEATVGLLKDLEAGAP
jgi:pimeloyl-ACP methyl ester carboxylesterase